MGYARRATKRIKGIDPQAELTQAVADLRAIEKDAKNATMEKDGDWIRAQELRLKAVNARVKIYTDMMDRVVPRARPAEVQPPKQLELPFTVQVGDEIHSDIGDVMDAVKHGYRVQ